MCFVHLDKKHKNIGIIPGHSLYDISNSGSG